MNSQPDQQADRDAERTPPSFGRLGPFLPWISIVVVLLVVYVTRGVLLPFLFGLAVAYFLDPIADRLEARGIARSLAAALVIFAFFVGMVGLLIGMWPILSSQIAKLVEVLPSAIAELRTSIEGIIADLSASVDPGVMKQIEGAAADAISGVFSRLQGVAGNLVSSGLALFNLLTLMLISPVVAFYLLRDWDDLVARINSWLPPEWGGDVREQAGEVDRVLAGFVRGQISVCLIMGILYGFGWWAVGLDFALLLGLLAGVMAFIPFVGTLVALVLAIIIGLGQWGFDPVNLALVVGVFGVVQLLEGTVLTPNLVGDSVGLHPVWVLFAVFAGGEIMGFVGVLIAVPAAAAIAVVLRYALKRYLRHHGLQPPALDDTEEKAEKPST